MKIKKIIYSSVYIIIIVFLIILLLSLFKNRTVKSTLIYNDRCSNKEYYFDYNEQKVYLYCIKSIMINVDGQNYELKDAINQNLISFSRLLKKAKASFSYWDGGSTLYKYDNFSIIVYHHILEEGKYCNDIIIGGTNINIKDFCN